MHSALPVEVLQTSQESVHHLGSVVLGEEFVFGNFIEELSTFTNVGNDVVSLFAFVGLVDLQDIGVVQVFENADLILHGGRLLLVHPHLSQDFDCPQDRTLLVSAFSHFAIGTLAQLVAQNVVLDELLLFMFCWSRYD